MKHTRSFAGAFDPLDETADELYEQAPCGYISTLPDGTIVRANKRAASMVGRLLPAERIRFHELLTTGALIYYETHVSPLLHMQGHVEEIALELKGRAGAVPVLLNAVLHRDEVGDPVAISASLVDVTERRRYERELLAARNEAEEAARLKGELISMVSHDIRTPIGTLMSVGELLERTPLTADQAKFVQILKTSTANLMNLVNDVLDLGKLEAGRMRLEQKPLDIRLLVEMLAAELRLEAERKGLALQVAVDPDVPCCLIGDPIKIGRIISNLLGNAIKFTDHGSVRIAVTVAGSDRGKVTLRFEIRDTGIGIDQDLLGRVFDDFTQGSQDIVGRYGGSGLGLGICKKLLAMYGSALQIESEPDKGSTFWFDLELACDDTR